MSQTTSSSNTVIIHITSPSPIHDKHLFASLNRILNSIIPRLPNLRLEVQIHQLSLIRSPLPIRIPIINLYSTHHQPLLSPYQPVSPPPQKRERRTYHLSTPSIPNLNRRMTNRTLSAPLDVIASTLSNEERLRAALVGVAVDAFFDGEIEDFA